ncbi:glycoside hydrolase family 2 TIM barrel-domain containing protein [Opitutales bacterium ASA1]|uniref:glycoside hydrolase family 2 TIM barrel-domain containing protein n=1 Tax=Congregicoccus parvus TaxID=3081749 RepID=UPI002B2FEAA1|nr:glycoside hydrolase family 2 TIM barrel-domain containing protein [Opitutales bacterium ASA1]
MQRPSLCVSLHAGSASVATVFTALLLVLVAMQAAHSAPTHAVTVQVRPEGGWRLSVGGEPFTVRGVGGIQHLDTAAAIGANTIRTWGVDQIEQKVGGRDLLDRAHALGLKVVVGLWLQHERHGFDYDDSASLERQRADVRAWVRRYRDHPAVLLWGLGNEMEGFGEAAAHPRIWRELEHLARIVKEEDPHHPVMTVLANAERAKLDALRRFAPSVDIVGINLYGAAPRILHLLGEAAWHGPFMLTEFGPPGPWEVPHTTWDAPIEPLTRDKAALYSLSHHTSVNDAAGRCLGTFCFLWGQKQEATSSWFSMFLESGERTPLVDAMETAFTGKTPASPSPEVVAIEAEFATKRVVRESVHEVRVVVQNSAPETLEYTWSVTRESSDRRHGGDREAVPADVPDTVVRRSGDTATIRIPSEPGAYRLFVVVRDRSGGGCIENVPFFVE